MQIHRKLELGRARRGPNSQAAEQSEAGKFFLKVFFNF